MYFVLCNSLDNGYLTEFSLISYTDMRVYDHKCFFFHGSLMQYIITILLELLRFFISICLPYTCIQCTDLTSLKFLTILGKEHIIVQKNSYCYIL